MTHGVRAARPADRDDLVEMMEEFYAEAGTPFARERSGRAFDEILRDEDIGRAWILESNGTTAGYVVLTFAFSVEYGGRGAFVDDLFVRKAHRGRGLGRAAMDTVLEECRRRRVRALHLEVARDNAAAKALYRRFGFVDRAHHLMTRITEGESAGG